MPSDSNLSTQERAVKTTILTINLDDINWAQLKQYCHLVRYELPYQEQGKWAYLHNWYKETCNYPYLLQAPRNIRPSVYVKYPSEKEVLHLEYENSPLPRFPVDIEDLHVLHALVKTLLSDYFYQRDVFVSNADFFLPVSPTDRDFITALKIRINENWRHNKHNPASYEFFVADEGKQLRKLQQSELDSRNLWGGSYYALDYIDKMAVLRRLKPSQILKAANRRSAIYTEPFIKRTRATITYHSVRNLDALQQSRSYVLNQFLNGVLAYFAQIGLPFQLKELRMQQIRALSSTEMKKSQISIGNQTIYIVDDRIRPKIRPELEPDDFANQLLTSIQDLFSQENGSMPDSSSNMAKPTFAIGNAAELSEGDYVLRIQDNEENDFEDKTRINPKTGEEIIVRSAILKGNDDPLPEFYAAYPHLVKQSLNVNDNTRLRQDEKRKPKKQGKPQAWSVDSYLDYDLPKFDSNFQTKLEVCLNQLFLKDIVMYPQDIGVRLPEEQTKIIANKVFMFAESLMYFDGSNLHFIPVVNNYGQASKLIRDVTGKDLIRDVLKPAMERAKFEFAENDLTDEDETQKILRNGRFIISQDYVWQIEDNQGRILYPDEELEYRLENLEQRRHISEFYPEFPVTGDEPFTEAQLRDYKRFLQEHVEERFISYNELKQKYGKHIKEKDEQGKSVKQGEGIFSILGINRDSKFKHYLRDHLGLPIENTRSQDVMSVYQGIWYEPGTQQYLVGSKDSRQDEQEKGLVFRQIVVLRGNEDEEALFRTLDAEFFPMLQVNFIRHRSYTVYPFPFKLIEIWYKIQGNSQKPPDF